MAFFQVRMCFRNMLGNTLPFRPKQATLNRLGGPEFGIIQPGLAYKYCRESASWKRAEPIGLELIIVLSYSRTFLESIADEHSNESRTKFYCTWCRKLS